MSFLAPLFLAAAAVVAVPVLLHLFQRRPGRRMAFPALRYLLRTEREHARRIRLRQLLLLVLRVGAVLALVLAGARLVLGTRGGAHEPTALAIVLDNSLSSARVTGEARVLDELERVALAGLAQAGPEDRIWVLRVGEPWDVAVPGDAAAARERVRATVPTDARGDVAAALRRARSLVESQDLPGREIHLVSDLQRTGFTGRPAGAAPAAPPVAPAGDVPVLVWRSEAEEGASSRWLREVQVGGGLPPLAGRRTDLRVGLGASEGADTAAVPLRVVVDERVLAAGRVRPDEDAVFPVGPFAGGSVTGWAEADPDALAADDRRYFAFDLRPPPAVRRAGAAAPFLDEALGVLTEAGRIEEAPAGGADVLLSVGGAELGAREGAPAVILPPDDPVLLPGLNRALASAGIPWRLQPPRAGGETVVADDRTGTGLDDLRVERRYVLEPTGGDGTGTDGAGTAVLARTRDGAPLLVGGEAAGGRWLLAAVPASPGWSELPVSASMVPFLEWAVGRWAAVGSGREDGLAGEPLSLPAGADAVELPTGERVPVGPDRRLRRTGTAGFYRVLAGDSVLETVALNTPVAESLPDALGADELEARVGPGAIEVGDPDAWGREVFRLRRGTEPWRPLLLAALLLLVAESLVAAGGRREKAPSPASTPLVRSAV